MSSVSVNNNLVSYKRLRNLFLGLFIFATSCGKIENEIVDTSYARSDIVATEAAFTLVNSNMMATENNFRGSTCTSSYLSTERTQCGSPGGVTYETSLFFDRCTFNNGTIRVIPYNGVLSPWFESHARAACPVPISVGDVLLRYFDDLDTSPSKEKVKYLMPNQDTVEFDNNGATLSVGNVMGTMGINIKQETSTQRTLAIDSVHILRRDKTGNPLYSVYVKTTNSSTYDLTVDGTLSGGDREANGFVYVHNGVDERIKTNFQAVKWGVSACCYPTQGSMRLEFETGPNVGKTSTVNFTSSCGSAEITGVNGEKSALNFTECY